MTMMEEHLKNLKSEVDDIDKNIGWNSLFATIRSATGVTHDFPCAAAKSVANKALNRYRDVSPFDHSRVVLTKDHFDYINASLVQVSRAGRRYILTQGPLPQTAGHFWLMIWEQNSTAILMLNKVVEKNQIKCHQYWPLGAIHRDSDVMEFPDVDLRVRYISEEQSRNFVVRTLRVEDMNTSESREVTQFHYTTWPDFGVPSTHRTFLHFLQVVRDSGVLNANVGPPVVHCSAGIGRSGTFCLVDSVLLMMEEGLAVSIKDVLMDMRKFRMGLIQTADQLRFSYLAILEGLQQLTEGNRRFIADQNENDPVDVIEIEERPAPPPRSNSLPIPPSIQDELYRRLIEAQVVDRPLPDIPTSDEESDVDSILGDDDNDDDSASMEKSESSKEEPVLPIPEESQPVYSSNLNGASNNSPTPSSNSNNDNRNLVEPDEVTNISDIKTNGVSSDEADLRRRAKTEATRKKIMEIKAHQKEAEAVQGFYRSPEAKRRKESRELDHVVGDDNIADDDNSSKTSLLSCAAATTSLAAAAAADVVVGKEEDEEADGNKLENPPK